MNRFKWLGLGLTIMTLLLSAGLVLYIYLFNPATASSRPGIISQSILGEYNKAAVAVDGTPCAKIAKDVLLEGGFAVDAAVAGMFCNGLYSSQSMGLGGGFMMTLHQASTGETISLNAREAAPAAATRNMFRNCSECSQHGPRSVAVPGEAAGYWAAKQRFGNPEISWSRIMQPSIDMARSGITVSRTKAEKLRVYNFTQSKMREVFIDPETGKPWLEGDVYTRPKLADTLERMAEAGDRGEENLGFYTGVIGENLVSDLKEMGGIISMDDMRRYKARWEKPVSVHLESLAATLYSVPPPGSGAVLAFILNILDNFNIKPGDDSPLLYHRMVEAYKWAFATRTELGDPVGEPEIREKVKSVVESMLSERVASERNNNISDSETVTDPSKYGAVYAGRDDHGTAHISVIGPGGDAVSATSTINLYFGSLLMSEGTGILYNDEMDDFSAPGMNNYFGVPPSPTNFIKGGKRPLSSMCPTIIVGDDRRVKLVIGAAGGTKITTAVAQTIIKNQLLGTNLKEAIDSRRIHHQLLPMEVAYEEETDKDILTGLSERGHKIVQQDSFSSVVVGVQRDSDGKLRANSDFRKSGAVDGF